MGINDAKSPDEYLAAIKAEYGSEGKAVQVLTDLGPLMETQDPDVLKSRVFPQMPLGSIGSMKLAAEKLAKLADEYVQNYLKKD